MEAVIFEKPGEYCVGDIPEPEIKTSGDVLIKVEAAGLCGTDLHIVSIPQKHHATEGIVLGHEFVGEVMEVGSAVKLLKRGMRVSAGPNIWCGECKYCKQGKRNYCNNMKALGMTINGGLAEYVVAPEKVLYQVPMNITPEQAVFAEPLSCVLNGFYKLNPDYNSKVVILGAGPIGQYFIRLCRHFGAPQIIATEPMAERAKIASSSGATHVVDPTTATANEELLDITSGGADIVIDTSGDLLEQAVKISGKGGKILLFGLDKTSSCSVTPYSIVREEKQIFGCFVDNDLIPACYDIIPFLSLEELISHRLKRSDIDKAFELLDKKESIKIIV